MSDKLNHLLPCPFCGCTKVPKRQGNGIGDYWLECFDCGASTRLREDGAGMEKDWNRRPSPAPATPAEPMPIDGWYVEVAANGERVLTISDEAICGLDELDPFAPVIRGAAAQLISFIGPGRDHVGNHVALSQSDPVMDALPDDEAAPAISESEDAARLDFLDAMNARKNEKNGTRYGWRLSENHNRIALEDHAWPAVSVREAIDAARKGEKS